MTKPQPIQEPLSHDEIWWLKHIYRQRYSNLFFAGFFRCLAYCFIVSYSLSAVGIAVGAVTGFTSSKLANSFTGNLILAVVLALILAALATGYIHHKMVLPFKKDAESGVKLKIPLTIISKEYYPVTGQYFIRTEENFEKLKEVDESTYNSYNEGEYIWLYKGIHSGHIFGDNDSVRVRFFTMPGFGRSGD
jgi:hypothetical protein